MLSAQLIHCSLRPNGKCPPEHPDVVHLQRAAQAAIRRGQPSCPGSGVSKSQSAQQCPEALADTA
eukprot:3056150-Alexandrium_andersonii.AAC.1